MTSALETALEIVESFYQAASDKQIVGIYDAPLKVKQEDGTAV